MFVVDATVVNELLVTGQYTANAQALFRQVRPLNLLHVPEFCRLECANVLWKQVRFQGMPQVRAEKLLHEMMALPLTIVAAETFYSRALSLGVRHQLAVYDSVYIALMVPVSAILTPPHLPTKPPAPNN